MKTISNKTKLFAVALFSLALTSCDSTLDVDSPSDSVSVDDAYTLKNGIKLLHNGLYIYNFQNNAVNYTYIPRYYSMFSDDLSYSTTSYAEYYSNAYTETSSYVATIWNNTYKSIRQCNDFIIHMEGNTVVSEDEHNKYVGDAFFMRALNYFYLTNMFGDVPLILNLDDETNGMLARTSQSEIYAQVEKDLLAAAQLLKGSERDVTYFSEYACYALLARMYTYTEQWDKAREYADMIISSGKYELETIDRVYLASSKEAIFSVNMEGYSGADTYIGYTLEGYYFLPEEGGTPDYVLTESLVNLMQSDLSDQRNNWIDNVDGVYYVCKYKNLDTPAVPKNGNALDYYEYQNWFRLAEQYLIRAEALAHLNDLAGAVDDINVVRSRAGIESLDAANMTQQQVLDSVLTERHKEFFCEMGHRFFDLRRTGKIDEVLGACDYKSWEHYRQWLPVPQAELLNNPNLTQNEGYGD